MMKSFKKIETIFTPELIDEGDGGRFRRILGSSKLKLDPILLLAHDITKLPQGFPDHPHRGFETVSYSLRGTLLHEDSKGNKGKLEAGDVQWMTAGKGIVHSEMPGSFDEETESFQLWINLAAKNKFCNPQYQEIKANKIPVVTQDDVKVKVIAGESFGIKGPIHARTPAMYLDVELGPNAKFEQVIPKGWNLFAYVYEGKALFGDGKQNAGTNSCVVFKNDTNDVITVENSDTVTKFLLLGGLPIGEPVVSHGPFVLNTKKEVEEAIQDYRYGRNGFENAPDWVSENSNLASKRM